MRLINMITCHHAPDITPIAVVQPQVSNEPNPDFIRNRVCLYDDNGTETVLTDSTIKNLRIVFDADATDNTLRIHKDAIWMDSVISVKKCRNCNIAIGRIWCYRAPGIRIWLNGDDARIVISDGVTFNGVFVINANYKSDVFIGKDCLCSSSVEIWATDYHTITDASGNVINIPRGVHIGNHCWLGANVGITKNAYVSDGSVIGACSVVGGTFKDSNVILAGNPARIVRRDIRWDRRIIDTYLSVPGNK